MCACVFYVQIDENVTRLPNHRIRRRLQLLALYYLPSVVVSALKMLAWSLMLLQLVLWSFRAGGSPNILLESLLSVDLCNKSVNTGGCIIILDNVLCHCVRRA